MKPSYSFIKKTGLGILSSIALLSATTFPFTVNIPSTVTFSSSGGERSYELEANQAKDVTLSWVNSTRDVNVKIVSKSARHGDTTMVKEIEVNNSTYPSWEAKEYSTAGSRVNHNGKNWENAWWANPGDEPGRADVWKLLPGPEPFSLSVVVSPLPLPTDSAFIPVRSNVEARLRATPLNLTSGSLDKTFELSLSPHKLDTLILPLSGGETSIADPISNIQRAQLQVVDGNHLLQLPSSFINGRVNITSVQGRVVGSMDLNAPRQNSLSIWDVSAGVYIIQSIGVDGKRESFKMMHSGGDIQLHTSFSSSFSVGGLLNSSEICFDNICTAQRGGTASYRIEVTPLAGGISDSVYTLNIVGQINPTQIYMLLDPNKPSSAFQMLLDSVTYEELFPYRYGLGFGAYADGNFPENPNRLSSDGDYDFFTYESLLKAVDSIGQIEVDLYQLRGHNYMHRIEWRNKRTGETRNLINNQAYNTYKSTNEEYLVQSIDYANFAAVGDLETRKRDLAAFLANISHETTGQGSNDIHKKWGLYWREEAAWQNGSTSLGYVDQFPNALYPPTPGQSYHGRGPIQITHNVNYGQLSEFFYGNKQILLDNPGKLVPAKPADATLAFMSAIWFWMTPQAPKPSCHDVMTGQWEPTPADIAGNRHKSKFGMTINIINGGLECGGSDTDHRIVSRSGYYKRYAREMNIEIEEYLGCGVMTKY